MLNGEWSGHTFVARRFQAEARIASTIGHPNIVEVFDAGQLPNRRLFLVMEHLDGHDLAQEIADRGILSPLRSCEILRQVALDFGIACSPRATAHEGQRLTLPGSVMGTPDYMAPEQSTNAEPNPRFDLYALGATTLVRGNEWRWTFARSPAARGSDGSVPQSRWGGYFSAFTCWCMARRCIRPIF